MSLNVPKFIFHAGRTLGLAGLICMGAAEMSALQISVIEHVVTTANSFPDGVVQGPDKALWFTEYGAAKIARMPLGGKITEYPVPTPDSSPYGITVGPDGALWFTEYFTNKIGRVTTQ